ncbi:hypothetical protein GALL_272100 [mine drainage metagenome]|uniref:Uncharacterized protein n=1 Tax=mine drainage metagenome TaxID=410659 RepID=A0A1J5R4M4_9ZZZZ
MGALGKIPTASGGGTVFLAVRQGKPGCPACKKDGNSALFRRRSGCEFDFLCYGSSFRQRRRRANRVLGWSCVFVAACNGRNSAVAPSGLRSHKTASFSAFEPRHKTTTTTEQKEYYTCHGSVIGLNTAVAAANGAGTISATSAVASRPRRCALRAPLSASRPSIRRM